MKISSLILSLGCLVSPILVHSDTWNPVPPIQIPSSSSLFSAPTTSFSTTLGDWLVTWTDFSTNLPFYTQYNGSFTTPVTIPSAATSSSAVFSDYSSNLSKFLVTWQDSATHYPFYATYDGTTWSTPTAIPGSLAAALNGFVIPSPSTLVGEFLVTWIDLASSLPFYATYNGTAWSTPVAIPGSLTASSGAYAIPTFGASINGGTLNDWLVTWVDSASNLPFYALYNGTSWTTPVAISGSHTVAASSPIFTSYDSVLDRFLATWEDSASSLPFFAVYNGTSWTTPANIPHSSTMATRITSSFGTADDLFLVTWLDFASLKPFYATFDGLSWSIPVAIPSSVPADRIPFSAASTKEFLVTWASGAPTVPFYSTLVPSPAPPVTIVAVPGINKKVLQQEYYINISWSAPSGVSWTPASYQLYRDPALTISVGTTTATPPLVFVDHNLKANAIYTYYLVATDTSGMQHFLGTTQGRS